ncbi:GDSL-type esterase/lipase family protein [Pelotomaculum terephthalicicum JT]|uniref:GDSL-type esterase/lipase family protein n=1 Tax=Pelotomaculum terephthalicicum TaxID=206393 RepID=UPI001F04314A|nr:GDSL-type esterase/lipase family protein [Pelotomaculum terephthalicicum]MCG9969520.1 GDSL-type esterase/lipase family protein [Pelotomaculum terephthalicicum JT]
MESSSYRRQYSSSPPAYFRLALVLLLLAVALGALAAFFRPAYTNGMQDSNTPAMSPGAGSPPAEQPITGPTASAPDRQDEVPVPPVAGAYDYSRPVPAAEVAVTDDYFQDSVFIGDSRTKGFQMLSGPRQATYYTSTGLKVDTILTKPVVKAADGKKTTIMEALRQESFKKVYIMLGINELGWAYSDLFIKKYGEVIAEIQKIEPEAEIYLQSILPVSEQKSQSDQVFNNTNISKYNGLIRQMAAEKSLYYLDVAQCVLDQEGNLASDASTDGIHLNKDYCDRWLAYLKLHYVAP